ncbi:MAG: DUF4837 family protein [Gemmatimonadota bacterium]
MGITRIRRSPGTSTSGREGTRLRLAVPALLLTLALAPACGRGPAYGSDNAIIAVVDPALRESVEPVLRASLEREVQTTRPEPIFEVTFTTPEGIGEFRNWKRLLVVEPGENAVLLPDLVDTPLQGPVTAEVHDEWANDQTIYVLAAPTEEGTVQLVRSSVDSLFGVIHERFVEHHVERMWASEPNSELADRLRAELGFSLVLPRVYRSAGASAPADSRVWYNEDPRRIVSIHWLPRPAELTPDTILAVRRAWGRDLFPGDSVAGSLAPAPAPAPAPATTADTTASATATARPGLQVERTRLDGAPAIRIQGVWTNTADVSSGVFVTYGVICGARMVLLDGNLYAPDRNKYPYVVQLDRIFETFRCADGATGSSA